MWLLKELEYPFDADYIIENKKRLRRELLEKNEGFTTAKVAIMCGGTVDNIKKVIELFLLNNQIKPEFYESEYNQYFEESVFPNEKLRGFAPDIVYICTSNHNINSFPLVQDKPEDVELMIKNEVHRYCRMWEKLSEYYNCAIIQNNFELPYYRLLGNRDSYDIHGAVNYVSRLNMEFYNYAQRHENFYICDLNYISAEYGLKKWSDPLAWHMYKYAVAISAIPYLSFNVANIIKSLMGKNKKGFVCDLDNTLWGGVIGDDGIDNICIGNEEPKGQAFLAFQKYLKAHKQLGIVLNVDSKNEMENAILGLNHPDGALKEDDFVCIKANWNPKDSNYRDIANELSLSPESLVFLDDNPAERDIVTSQIPGVVAPELFDVAHYIEILDKSGYFEVTSLSEDDVKRVAMYEKNQKRAEEAARYSDYGEYLKTLEMHAVIKPFENLYFLRITQLTNKSNQFNLTTRRYTQAEIEKVSANPNFITLYGRLEDKFGDNGLVSLLIGEIKGKSCHIDLWLMSCRVLKRDMEMAMMDMLVSNCVARGIDNIIGYYFPTAKNKIVANFYEEMGFEKLEDMENGGTNWKYDLSIPYANKNNYIKIGD